MQTTLNRIIAFEGVGLHSGAPVRMSVLPAPAGFGICFDRVDLTTGDTFVPARYDAVREKPLCTRIENTSGVEVLTVEHIMAALAGCGVSNALIELDGPEVPIMDGCSAAFAAALIEAGVEVQDAPLQAIEILKPIMVRDGDAVAMLSPAEGLEIEFQIDFEDGAIGSQSKSLNMANGTFVRELSDCRTFCRKADIDMMHASGFALGGTYENAVVVDGDAVLSPGGLRRKDEAVRHKMLDALGDLALAGAPILGRYTGRRAGHAMTNRLLRALFDAPDAHRIVTCSAEQARRLPGVGVKPADLPLVA
ncbi:MAG: UDP-3-O-acyl-N-acetylglucosamine deacetylase [Litoreibacter sp.]|nr:UDP-3-O-acyl-N-acetylglucosamine deacetylase [Litoreibacter sp.]